MKILGLESSCDETAAAFLKIRNTKYEIRNNVVWSQVKIHKKYGGVVPEVAARQHVEAIIPVIESALSGMKPDLIAVTQGPGLMTSLAVGVQTAKTLAYSWRIPLVGVNHLEGHLWSFLLNHELRIKNNVSRLKFPAMALIVSGGHTELILVRDIGKYKLIGQTRDDAVGEAFDKVAKMLDLGYPGGPIVAHFAKIGNPDRIHFPRPMLETDDFDFSFSGLKTSVKYHLEQMLPTGNLSSAFVSDVCASFQAAVIEVLTTKTIRAADKFKAQSIILGGGVSANEKLTKNLKLKTENIGLDFYYPEKWLTGDNAAMIALAGYFSKQKAGNKIWQKLKVQSNLNIC